ncbi:hypothetical protein AB8B21_17675 [Tardiphaga sp. 866_E4_N2_1]|uniref:hypothetical protein n=1 Tax=unclassified Tardiphaga TaxID=2631404 RepID=UPI003F29349B
MTTSAVSMNEIHANSLLASTFTHPREVLANPFLDTLQKRCVLAAWASDAFTVEGKPWLRQIPGSNGTVRIGDILAALSSLDEDDSPPPKMSRMPLPGAPIRIRAVGQTAREDGRRRLADLHP